MTFRLIKRCVVLGFISLFSVGCGQSDSDAASESGTESAQVGGSGAAHAGWWCTEHGLPEEDCSMCSTNAADDFKAKGDWCEEHNRAESQCFICDSSRETKFAALYEAKFGEKPPKPTE